MIIRSSLKTVREGKCGAPYTYIPPDKYCKKNITSVNQNAIKV